MIEEKGGKLLKPKNREEFKEILQIKELSQSELFLRQIKAIYSEDIFQEA